MAMTGVLITCAVVGGRSVGGAVQALLSDLIWSQKMTAAGTTTQAAPTSIPDSGAARFEIRSDSDILVAYGPAPNVAAGPIIMVPANETRNVICRPGDKLAWALAS